jgi:hypothetical protein
VKFHTVFLIPGKVVKSEPAEFLLPREVFGQGGSVVKGIAALAEDDNGTPGVQSADMIRYFAMPLSCSRSSNNFDLFTLKTALRTVNEEDLNGHPCGRGRTE